MNCQHCGAETSNGLALCELAQRKTTLDLEYLPVYFRNLARWKPGRAGTRPVPGSREPVRIGAGADDKVVRSLDEASNDLGTWARMLADDRPGLFAVPEEAETEAATVAALCERLSQYLVTIATTEWAGQFVQDIGYHEAVLRGLTESVAPGWYAGACRRCEYPTHVVPGLTWVTCGDCGATTYARDHLNVVLKEARGWVARPMRIAEAIVALVDTEQSVPRLHKRISKWGERWPGNRSIEPLRKVDADGDCVGPKRYRLGDVLDMLSSEGATRTSDGSADTRVAS